ncbi:hypothetical protein KC901_00365 [Patescibacteria group bacterium]|nr:hypothetical protein [Patescibacteria group bacterium]
MKKIFFYLLTLIFFGCTSTQNITQFHVVQYEVGVQSLNYASQLRYNMYARGYTPISKEELKNQKNEIPLLSLQPRLTECCEEFPLKVGDTVMYVADYELFMNPEGEISLGEQKITKIAIIFK